VQNIFFFDKKTNLLVKEEIWQNGTLINDIQYLDYKKFGSIIYPETVKSTILKLNITLTSKTEKIEFNQIFEDSFFEVVD
jgi:hypothetical protein